MAITIHSTNGNKRRTIRSINGKIYSRKKKSVEMFKISHGQKTILFLKALGKVGSAGKS